MGTKFIRNTDDASIVCRIPSDKNKVFNFRCKKFDKRNNILLSNGYTEVSDEDLALLEKESKVYLSYTKMGKLTIVDELPHESMSPEQLIASLRMEVASLKQQLKGATKGDVPSGNLKEALETITELQKKVIEQERMIEALDTQLADAFADLAEEVGKE